MKTQLRHFIILITLMTALLGAGTAWAVDVTGNVDAQTISSNTTWNVTGTVNLRGRILIKSGATLTIQPKAGSTANRVIRRRNNWNGNMFEVEDGGSLVVKACTTNGTVYKMYFDGGATFTDNDARKYSGSGTAPSNYGTGVIIRADGNLTMTDAVVRYGYNPGAGAGIRCYNGGTTGRTFNLTRVTIQACWAKDGSAVYFGGKDYHNATMTSCVIEKCNAVSDSNEGGSIRTNGGVKTSLTLNACTIRNNHSKSYGAGIYWNAAGIASNKVTIKGATKIYGNAADANGGGVFIESRMDLQQAEIYSNTADRGAGIYFCTYGGGADTYDGNPFNASISSNVIIRDNHATAYGGGLYLAINKSSSIGYNPAGAAIDVEYKLTVDGGQIYGNYAPLGGGVAILDFAPKKVKYPINEVTHGSSSSTNLRLSGEYKRTITISSGSVYNNYNDSGNKYGGGFYIRKYKDSDIADTGTGTNVFSYQAVGGAGTMNVSITGGNIYHNGINGTATAPTTAYGGAMFITDEMGNVSPYLSQCNVGVSGTANIYQNQCTTNGGAIWLSNAVFTMTGGTIGGSTTNANKSTGGSGGGFYITGAYSKVTVSGGSITYNTAASGNGGGFYVANSSSDGTTISGTAKVKYNEAKNGGGAFINAGKLAVNGSSAEVSNNKATAGNGGGIYANGGTVTLTAGTLANNTATGSGTTGLGGGVYSKGALTINGATIGGTATTAKNTAYDGAGVYVAGGTVSHTSGSVRYNEASHDGGGIYSTSGTVTINGANAIVSNNTATAGNGGGLYVGGGTLSVTSGKLESNKAAQNGGGIYSSSGSVTLTSAQVNSNTATNGNGGGVYAGSSVTVTSSNLTGNIATNSTNGMGGGIYATGTNTEVSIDGTSSAKSLLTSNQARLGGGVYAAAKKVTVGYATIGDDGARNTATADGGGLYVAGPVTLNTGAVIQCNTASNDGGGVYVNNGTFTMTTGTIGGSSATYANIATNGNGGGVYVKGSSAKVEVKGGSINYNSAPSTASNKGNGGGIYVESTGTDGTSISGNATINNNTAQQNGGGVYVVNGTFTIGSATISSNTATAHHGGGVYLGNGTFNLNASGVIESNHANSGNGGGVYMAGGTFNHNAGNIGRLYASANTAINGAGLYVNAGNYYSKSTSSTIIGNDATSNGGGIYMNGGNCYLQGGHIGDNGGTQLNEAVNGAGLYMAGTGHFEMTNASSYIRGNHATTSGGGIYMEGGTCSITAGTIGASGYSNQAVNGGGIYAAGGTITVNGGNINYNTATGTNGYGGGIYSYSGTVTVQSGNITYNTAATDGGGIYARGTVDFSNGSISNNTATAGNGGGVFIYSTGTLNVSGTATMTANTATAGMGGGVYQGGIMTADGTSLSISNNTNGRAKNNVYLPDGQTIKVGPHISTNVILGIYTENIATVGNDIPVLTCDNGNQTKLNDIYSAMLTGASNIHDDRGLHQPIYTGTDATGKTLYFGFIQFDYPTFTSDFSNPIDSREKLYQFMCWVNGVNGYAYAHPGAEGNLTADIEADFNLWIPIGEANMIGATDPYTGNFHGNGHVISGLSIADELYSHYGLFGTTQGANIDNLFVNDFTFHKTTPGAMGLLVGNMQGGTLANSTCAGTLIATVSDCIVGGMVGKLEQHNSTAGTIHSSYAGTNQTGYQMGGLVGEIATGCNLYNSYANPSFTHSGSGTEYVGGLVAVNTGHIENCYVRLERTQSLGSARFGMLAGSNSGTNTIVQCYAPDKSADEFNLPSSYYYLYNNATTGLSNCNTFSKAVAPYLYNNDGDNLVTGTTTKLVNTLNTWVNLNSGHDYAPWRRTMAGGAAYSATAGDINGDYPVHQYANTDCVCASGTEALAIDYAATLTTMLTRHTSNATVNLYENDETDKATGSGVVVYIDEDVSLLQTDDTKDIAAYTCQTLKTYPAERWHYFSSSLSNSGIGFNYGTTAQVPFSWAENPCNVTFSTTDDQALFPSDVPNINKVDLYCFYEPEYHWINLKRNTASHWHMNAPTVPIVYIGNGTGGDGNETDLVPGKGYLVSIDREQLVQNGGTLNNGDVTLYNVTKTDFNAWAGLLGYNLLGNPYQSYLDIEEFMTENNTALWGSSKDEASVHTYAVYDPETDCYLQYKRGVSRGARATTGLLNPHQGFLIRKTTTDSGTNTQVKFTNAMRSNDGTPSFREPQPAYPLVNVILTDSQGRNDLVVLELGRDADEGVEKLRVGECSGRIGLAMGNESYAILFRDETAEQQALRFEAEEEGEFSLRWETANAEFESLTLVDNIEGTTTDMLSRDSYSFEGNPDQYASRFRIVIGEYKGIEEEDGPSTGSGTFAYQMGDQLVVEGEGTLEVVDMLGHVVMTERLSDGQSRVRVPQTAGVYLLRLTGKNGTRTQKIVTK